MHDVTTGTPGDNNMQRKLYPALFVPAKKTTLAVRLNGIIFNIKTLKWRIQWNFKNNLRDSKIAQIASQFIIHYQ